MSVEVRFGSTHARLTELAESLGISAGPSNRRRDGKLSRAEKNRLLRIAYVLERAERLLGNRDRGLEWLKHPNRALRFTTPLFQLETSAGTERVLDVLGRMGTGAFA